MKAQAPGKVVLSGAYAVLEGAPAVVSAVNRYVFADASRDAVFFTEEVRAAGLRSAPWFDASALRTEDRKLGLGSSAAILAASLAADVLSREPHLTDELLARIVFPKALRAHALAQPLGSGIDVCATCFGGTRVAQRRDGDLQHEPAPLPVNLHVEIWAAPRACSTSTMLAILFEFRRNHPTDFSKKIQAQADASAQAVEALRQLDAAQLVSALQGQFLALQNLGRAAGLSIVTEAVATLAAAAGEEAAAVLPAGAGGGDVAIYAGPRPPSEKLKRLMAELEHESLNLVLGCRGVHSAAAEC